MGLDKVKVERYSAKVRNVSECFNGILNVLSPYLIKSGKAVKEYKGETGFINDDFSGIYGSNGINLFEIPSIRAFLRIEGRKEDSEGRTRGGSIIYSENGSLDVDFSYLNGTPDSDLKFIRNVLMDNGLEEKV